MNKLRTAGIGKLYSRPGSDRCWHPKLVLPTAHGLNPRIETSKHRREAGPCRAQPESDVDAAIPSHPHNVRPSNSARFSRSCFSPVDFMPIGETQLAGVR